MKKDNKITIEYIARQAMVSPGTVDRVIHDRAGVSEETRKRVLKIISDLDYQPDILARALATRKSFRLAAIFPSKNAGSAFWRLPEIGMDSAQKEIAHFGVKVEKFPYQMGSAKSFEKQASRALESDPDGIVMAPLFAHEAKRIATICLHRKMPMVCINSMPDGIKILSFVGQDSYASGKVAASLMNACTGQNDLIAVINIARDLKNQVHLVRREQGFIDHFEAYHPRRKRSIVRITIMDQGVVSIQKGLEKFFIAHREIKGVFVTNSRVYHVAESLKNLKRSPIVLIGYDLLAESKQLLEDGYISFLISQKPEEQGFLGIMSLFQHLVMKREVPKMQYLPIDIITKENIPFYKPT